MSYHRNGACAHCRSKAAYGSSHKSSIRGGSYYEPYAGVMVTSPVIVDRGIKQGRAPTIVPVRMDEHSSGHQFVPSDAGERRWKTEHRGYTNGQERPKRDAREERINILDIHDEFFAEESECKCEKGERALERRGRGQRREQERNGRPSPAAFHARRAGGDRSFGAAGISIFPVYILNNNYLNSDCPDYVAAYDKLMAAKAAWKAAKTISDTKAQVEIANIAVTEMTAAAKKCKGAEKKVKKDEKEAAQQAAQAPVSMPTDTSYVTQPPPPDDTSGDNTLLYAGIGAVVLLGGGAFLLLRKGKKKKKKAAAGAATTAVAPKAV